MAEREKTLNNPIPFKVTPTEREQLDALAARLGMNRSQVIRHAVKRLLEAQR